MFELTFSLLRSRLGLFLAELLLLLPKPTCFLLAVLGARLGGFMPFKMIQNIARIQYVAVLVSLIKLILRRRSLLCSHYKLIMC